MRRRILPAARLNDTEGYACVGKFRSVEDALRNIQRDLPDVVLSDIGLPGMNGIEGVAILTLQGCVISSGLTRASNSSPVRRPSSTADSRNVMPFLCAFLAIRAALS